MSDMKKLIQAAQMLNEAYDPELLKLDPQERARVQNQRIEADAKMPSSLSAMKERPKAGPGEIAIPKGDKKFVGGVHRREDEVAEAYGDDQVKYTHASNCPWNYGHDCECGKKTLTHADNCMYKYGHDCTCAVSRQKEKYDPYLGEDDEDDLTESLRKAFEDYVKDKNVPDSKKSYKLSRDGDVCVVKDEKGVEVKRGSKTDCNDFITKKNRALNDSEDLAEAKGKSVNRELWDRIRSKGTVPSIDKERYTDMSDQGLEGPFRQKNGQVLYYDPKEGSYYNRDTDMYVGQSDFDAMNESSVDPKQAKLAKMKAMLDKLHGAVKETRAQIAKGKALKEAPIDQTVANPNQQQQTPGQAVNVPVKPGQPGQPPIPGQQPVGQTVPGQPQSPAQQPPASAGTQTVAAQPGQQVAPSAGQAGGAPVAPPAGTPAVPTGTATNAATTPTEQMKGFVQALASNPAAAKQLGTKLNTVR